MPAISTGLDDLDRAIKARNNAACGPAGVGYSGVGHQIGGGEWMQVVSLVGDRDWREHGTPLVPCLALQQGVSPMPSA